MAIALVAHAYAQPGASGGTTSNIDSTGGSLLLFGLSNGEATTTNSDSKSNTWTQLTEHIFGTAARISYAKNPTVGSGHNLTYSQGSSYADLGFSAWSGIDTTAPFDVENGAFSSSAVTTLATGSVTPSADGCLVFAVIVFTAVGVTSIAIDSGFTILDSDGGVGGNNYGGAIAYKILGAGTSGSAVAPTWTWVGDCTAATSIAVFKPAAGGGASVPWFILGPTM